MILLPIILFLQKGDLVLEESWKKMGVLTACLVLRYLEAGDVILRYGCRVCRGLKGLSATRVVGVCVCEPLRVEACWRQWSGWENRLTAGWAELKCLCCCRPRPVSRGVVLLQETGLLLRAEAYWSLSFACL